MIKSVLIFISILATVMFSYGQNTGIEKLPLQWTLEECIEYAKQNNIQLNTLRLSTSSAGQDLKQAKNNRLPSVAGSVSHSLVNSNNANPVVGGFQTQANFSGNYGINLSITLYNGGNLRNNIKSGELYVQSAHLSVQEATNDIILSITQAFLNVLLAKESIKTFQEVLVTSQEQLKQGQQRYDAGSISKKDLLQFESQIASDNYNLVNANNIYLLNITSLKQLLQLPTSYSMHVVVPEDIEPKEAILSLNVVQKEAIDTRAEIKNSEVAIRLAEVELDKARAARLPTINLGGGLYSGYSDNRAEKYFPQLNNNFFQNLNLGASIPIFSRNQNRTNIIKSKIVIEQAKLDLENAKIILNQLVEQAYINIQNAQAEYAAAGAQLKIAEETYNITNEQLKLGAINMVEVLQQKNAYVQALQNYIQSKYTAVLYNKIYKFYSGEAITF